MKVVSNVRISGNCIDLYQGGRNYYYGIAGIMFLRNKWVTVKVVLL
jgi:hypothetical protein